ncbi:hypothetical protein L195_g043828 [Trifolium pratense]|uniref:Uncharacterized protein n=1 Tax=Trifolium pratense TaxID=57577 RepID=A0A2K3MAC0_TRIPR|nr:hypothetical protein L195_g043828 [Trifolium pratense]
MPKTENKSRDWTLSYPYWGGCGRPHNTVLLKYSSHDKGCRPYMCNTSYQHSNCLDQFCKSFDSNLSSSKLEEIPLVATTASNSSQRGN